MFIIPFIHKKIQQQMPIHQYHILTVGGTTLWAEESLIRTIEADHLHPNGIYLVSKAVLKGDIAYCQVDMHKTNMTDFYTWNELPIEDKETFCWRTFYTFGSKESSWLPISNEKCLGPYPCQDLFDMIQTIS